MNVFSHRDSFFYAVDYLVRGGRKLFIIGFAAFFLSALHFPYKTSVYADTSEEDFRTAVHLMDDSLFAVAASEFNSFIELHPQSPRLADAQFNLAQCLFLSGNFAGSLSRYRAFFLNNPDDPRSPEAEVMSARCLEQLGNHLEAASRYMALYRSFFTSDFAPATLSGAAKNYFKADKAAADSGLCFSGNFYNSCFWPGDRHFFD